MKIHITNVYNFRGNDGNVERQHNFAKAARSIGFFEMGIFNYPVETDSQRELSTRIDGIIAALEYGDIVFMQLPTGNGLVYEQCMINRIKSYKDTKLVLILHDMEILANSIDLELKNKYISLYKMADIIVTPSINSSNILKSYNLDNILFCDNINIANSVSKDASKLNINKSYISLCQSDFYIKKLLMDAVEKLFEMFSIQYTSLIQNNDNEIHIGFGLHDKTGKYSVWVGVTMQSVIEHTQSKICFHVLHDDTLNDNNRNKLMTVANNGGHRVIFHYLDKNIFLHLSEQMKYYTIGAMFRIMLPEILSDLSKIIYLDADLLVNRNIKELWDTDISNYSMAAVPDLQVVKGIVVPVPVRRGEVLASRYFNSGLLYMNLDKIRASEGMYQKIMKYLANTSSSDLPDQDALNALYTDDTLLLDGSWNYFARNVRIAGEKELQPKVYHYVGSRPVFYYHTEMDELYFETTGRTPWGIEECKKQLKQTVVRATDRVEQMEKLLLQISMYNKKIIYYGEEVHVVKNIYKLLSIHEGDYRVLSEPKSDEHSILPCRPLSSILDEKEPYVVLALPDADGGKAIENLERLGLKNGVDFFNIRRLLWVYDGGYL